MNKTANKEINKEADSFQLKIFQEINKSNIGKNIMISPLSIFHILSLTANGAVNKTLTEMLQVLYQKNIIELNKNNKTIYSSIEKLKSVELANAIFTKFKPLDNFLKIVKEYKAKVDNLKNAAQVNKWCSNATHNKIPVIIDNINENDLMVLINAIYFKGKWKEKFNKKGTKKNTFMNFNTEPKEIDFMNNTAKYAYLENNDEQVISLNYLKDDLIALIILPKTQTDINTYIENFTIEKYNIMLKQLVNKKVIFSLPKFEINFEAEINQNFISMGMIDAFSSNADFSNMKKEKDIHISRIIHKTFIKIDEEGTEAAAATAVVMSRGIVFNPEPDPIMNVNHPFLFIIRNNHLPSNHDILFILKVEYF